MDSKKPIDTFCLTSWIYMQNMQTRRRRRSRIEEKEASQPAIEERNISRGPQASCGQNRGEESPARAHFRFAFSGSETSRRDAPRICVPPSGVSFPTGSGFFFVCFSLSSARKKWATDSRVLCLFTCSQFLITYFVLFQTDRTSCDFVSEHWYCLVLV